MRSKLLKSLHLILSLSKDEAKISCFFSGLLDRLQCFLSLRGPGAVPVSQKDNLKSRRHNEKHDRPEG
jgi:hypothetical protein